MEKKIMHVKAISQKDNRYSICSNDNVWFSDFGNCSVKKGDRVEVEYEQVGNFKNIKNITILTPEEQTPAILSADQYKPSKDKEVVFEEAYTKDILVALINKIEQPLVNMEELTDRAIASFLKIKEQIRGNHGDH